MNARRETYLGALPEPLIGEPGAESAAGGDPASHAEMADSLSLAFLVLLESLSPEQRAAFLLREVFDYPYDQIAAIVASSEDNARQLVARARRHVEQRRLIGVLALDIAEGGQIRTVTSVSDPDKLRHLAPLADLGPLRRPGRRDGRERGPAGPKCPESGSGGREGRSSASRQVSSVTP